MTNRVTQANSVRHFDNDLILNAGQIKSYYEDFAGCERVTIFPRLPAEGTGHIDMWAKFLSDDIVLVNELTRATLEEMADGTASKRTAVQIQKFLEERAVEIAAMGYQVIRVPMPSPVVGSNDIFRSYSNSLIVNKTAIVPRYSRPARGALDYEDEDLIAGYESSVRRAYEAAGLKVVFIDSDRLIASGGAIHCITMQLPKL